MKRLLLLALLVGCASGLQQPTRAGDYNTRQVFRVIEYTSESTWRSSRFWHLEDQPNWPWFLVLSGDGMACPAFAHELKVPLKGDYYKCRTQWRNAR